MYGNVTQERQFDFASLTTAARTYTYTYYSNANSPAYDRVKTAQVANASQTVTLASFNYDGEGAPCTGWSGAISGGCAT